MTWPRWLRRWWPSSAQATAGADAAEHARLEAIRKARATPPAVREAHRALDSFTRSIDRAMRGQQL